MNRAYFTPLFPLLFVFSISNSVLADEHSVETSWDKDAHVLPWSPGEGNHSFKVSREEASRRQLKEFFEMYGHDTHFSFDLLKQMGHDVVTSAQELPPGH